MSDHNPVNPLPPVVIALCLAVVAVEAVLSLADRGLIGGQTGVGWRIAAIQDYAVSPLVWDQLVMRGDFGTGTLARFFGYAFVHASFTQALFGAALLLALGKFVGDIFHPGAVLGVFFGSSVAGAVAYGLLAPGNVPLVGVYPAVYGLIGAFTYLMWLRLGRQGQNQFRAFQLIGFLMALQLFFGVAFGGAPFWIAEIAGFVLGIAVAPVLAPGGWQGFLRRIRQR